MLLRLYGDLAAGHRARAPMSPQVQEQGVDDLSEEIPVLPWKPGDPVRIVPDLREAVTRRTGGHYRDAAASATEAVVRAPVSPGSWGKAWKIFPKLKS